MKIICTRIFFISIVVLWYFKMMFTSVEKFKKLASIISIVCLIIALIAFLIAWVSTKFSKKELLVQILFGIIIIYAYIATGMKDESFIMSFMAIVLIKDIDIKKITKSMLCTFLIIEIFTIMLTILKIFPYSYTQKSNGFGDEYNILSILNQHGNINYTFVFEIIVLYLYTYSKKINIKKCILLQVLALAFYFLFYCRTGLILSTVGIWTTLLIKNKNISNLNWIIKKIIENFYLILFVFVYIVAMFFYNTDFYDLLNKIIPSRIMEANFYFTNVGISVLPREELYFTKYFIQNDNTQLYMLVSYGVLFTLIYLYIYKRALKNLINQNKKIEVLFILLFILYSYAEIIFLKPNLNFSILLLIYAFYPSRQLENSLEDCKNE